MAGVQIAFKEYDFTKGVWGSEWIGWDNFQRFFNSYQFSKIIWNTLSLSFYSLLIGFPLPILFALVLNSFTGHRFKKLVQSVSYMPHFISTVVIVGMLVQIFNPRTGAFGSLYTMLTDKIMPDILANQDAFQHLYVWSGIWQSIGWSSIIYIAALSSVDEHLHEAAQIDGASRLQRVRHIDFPSILPTATIMLILAAGNIMDVGFEKVFLMQNNLNLAKSEVISTYVYKVGLTIGTGDFSFATAIGLFNSVINFILLIGVNFAAKRLSDTSLW
ncbi:ABC transporter permease subunit [Paenibacillus sp. J5C_2022]|nr:ABC transporter permease subunit [Paenibacillus sp. J5C2022]